MEGGRVVMKERMSMRIDQLLIDLRGNPFGQTWYVDSVNGTNSTGNGKHPTAPFLTIAYAISKASAGDTIVLIGTTFSEAVTVSKAGLRLLGVGTGPNQTTWTGAADAVCATVTATDVLFAGIKFRPPAYSAGVPAAIQLGIASNNVAAYCRIQKCRFQGKTGSYIAIYAPVPTDNVRVEECEFFYLNNITTVYGTAILGVQDASYNAFSSWVIRGNEFKAPVQGIKLAGRGCIIEHNNFAVNGLLAAGTMGAVTGSAGSKKMIDLRGNGHEAGCNDVHGNYLGGAYNNTLYFQGYSDDDWSGNFNIAGITTALPTT